MAGFNIRGLTLYASAVVSPGKAINFYKYATADANATMLTAGYFNAARDKVKVNDVIEVVSVATGVGVLNTLTVTAAPATGDVTVANSFGAPA